MADTDPPEPKTPEPKPEEPKGKQPKEQPKRNLPQALAELSKTSKLAGHQLLGHIASAEGAPPELAQAAHDLAFVVNTGLAGHAAAEGLRKMAPDALAKLLEETIADKPTVDDLAKKLRDLFPEPKRNQPSI